MSQSDHLDSTTTLLVRCQTFLVRLDEIDVTKFLDEFGIHGHSSKLQTEVATAIAGWITEDSLGRARLETELYPKDLPPGVMGMMFFRTNIYIHTRQVRDEQFFVLLAGLAALINSGWSAAGTASVAAEVRALWKRLGRLTEDQAEAARRLARLMDGQSIYEASVGLPDYLAGWPSGEDEKARRLLDELKHHGVVKETLKGWTFVR